jgi:hypothetical protein
MLNSTGRVVRWGRRETKAYLLRRSILGLLLVCAGCTVADPGESTPLDCHDGRDNDHDGMKDCKDPGCRALESCPDEEPEVIPTPMGAVLGAPDATVPLPQNVLPAVEAGSEDLDAGEEPPPPDAQPPVDAAMPEPPPCGGRCTPTQSCIDEECQDVTSSTEGRFLLRVVSAELPFWAFWPCLESIIPGICLPPDPIVRVLLVREGAPNMAVDAIELGWTSAAVDSPMAVFTDPPMELELEPGDGLRFEVWEADVLDGSARFVYRCNPDLRELETGLIECSDVVLSQRVTVAAELTPDQ